MQPVNLGLAEGNVHPSRIGNIQESDPTILRDVNGTTTGGSSESITVPLQMNTNGAGLSAGNNAAAMTSTVQSNTTGMQVNGSRPATEPTLSSMPATVQSNAAGTQSNGTGPSTEPAPLSTPSTVQNIVTGTPRDGSPQCERPQQGRPLFYLSSTPPSTTQQLSTSAAQPTSTSSPLAAHTSTSGPTDISQDKDADRVNGRVPVARREESSEAVNTAEDRETTRQFNQTLTQAGAQPTSVSQSATQIGSSSTPLRPPEAQTQPQPTAQTEAVPTESGISARTDTPTSAYAMTAQTMTRHDKHSASPLAGQPDPKRVRLGSAGSRQEPIETQTRMSAPLPALQTQEPPVQDLSQAQPTLIIPGGAQNSNPLANLAVAAAHMINAFATSSRDLSMLARLRIILLQSACEKRDVLFLAIHQVFCLSDTRSGFLNSLPSYTDEAKVGMVNGLTTMQTLLHPNKQLKEAELEFFTNFPLSMDQHSPYTEPYTLMIHRATDGCRILGAKFSGFARFWAITACRPPLIHDIKSSLNFDSRVFRKTIFISVARQICNREDPDGAAIAKALPHFNRDDEMHLSRDTYSGLGRPPGAEDKKAEESKIVEEYNKIFSGFNTNSRHRRQHQHGLPPFKLLQAAESDNMASPRLLSSTAGGSTLGAIQNNAAGPLASGPAATTTTVPAQVPTPVPANVLTPFNTNIATPVHTPTHAPAPTSSSAPAQNSASAPVPTLQSMPAASVRSNAGVIDLDAPTENVIAAPVATGLTQAQVQAPPTQVQRGPNQSVRSSSSASLNSPRPAPATGLSRPHALVATGNPGSHPSSPLYATAHEDLLRRSSNASPGIIGSGPGQPGHSQVARGRVASSEIPQTVQTTQQQQELYQHNSPFVREDQQRNSQLVILQQERLRLIEHEREQLQQLQHYFQDPRAGGQRVMQGQQQQQRQLAQERMRQEHRRRMADSMNGQPYVDPGNAFPIPQAVPSNASPLLTQPFAAPSSQASIPSTQAPMRQVPVQNIPVPPQYQYGFVSGSEAGQPQLLATQNQTQTASYQAPYNLYRPLAPYPQHAQVPSQIQTPMQGVQPGTPTHAIQQQSPAPGIRHGIPLSAHGPATAQSPAEAIPSARAAGPPPPPQQTQFVMPANPPPPASQPLVPRHGFQPMMIANPDPDVMAIHQQHLRSPKMNKVGRNGLPAEGIQLYQYPQELMVQPFRFGQTVDTFHVKFHLTPEEFKLRPVDTLTDNGLTVVRTIRNDNVTYRIRCVKAADDRTDFPAYSEWFTTPTYWPVTIHPNVNDLGTLDLRRKHQWGADLPIDITPHVRAGENVLQVAFMPKPDFNNIPSIKDNLFISIERVRIVDRNALTSLVQTETQEQTLAKLKRILNPPTRDADDDDVTFADPSLTIDITDPFSGIFCHTPVRTTTCLHHESFDLISFIASRTALCPNSTSPAEKWLCPICKADARPEQLVRNLFLEEIVKKAVDSGLSTQQTRSVIVKPDGRYTFRMLRQGGSTAASGRRRSSTAASRFGQTDGADEPVKMDLDGISGVGVEASATGKEKEKTATDQIEVIELD